MRPLPSVPEIFYHPPKSAGFGHASVPRDAKRGWEKTLAFLDSAAVYSLRPRVELRIQYQPQWNDAQLIERLIGEATQEFGEASRSDGPVSKQWDIPGDALAQAVSFSLRDEQRPKQEIGPTWLHFVYDLWWKAHPALPANDQPGEGSHLGVFHGGRKLFLQPSFHFPFEAPSSDFKVFISSLQMQLPFRLQEKNFKVLLPSPSGKSPRIRNLQAGWLAA